MHLIHSYMSNEHATYILSCLEFIISDKIYQNIPFILNILNKVNPLYLSYLSTYNLEYFNLIQIVRNWKMP